MPRSYIRTTLDDFAQPIDAALVEKLFAIARGRQRPIDVLHMTFEDHVGTIFHEEIAVPRDLAKTWAKEERGDHDLVARALSDWIATADRKDLRVEICDALLCRTEHTGSDAAWETQYDRELTRVFGAAAGLGRDAMQSTESSPGTRWTLRVAIATVDAMTSSTPAGAI